MWIRKRLDIGWLDLMWGFTYCLRRGKAQGTTDELKQLLPNGDNILTCLSVRTGLDLFLAARQFERGSEIVISGLTIPDMPRIIENHGLVSVPVDLTFEKMIPSVGQIKKVIGPRTRAVIIAHLFGTMNNLTSVSHLCREKGIYLIEDCAQAFEGVDRTEHAWADISMFSFGSIKTATALGGAILVIKDTALRLEMESLQHQLPPQSIKSFVVKLFKYTILKLMSGGIASSVLFRLFRAFGIDYDNALQGSVKGFPGPDLFLQIRKRPCTPLLKLMQRRFKHYDTHRLNKRTAKGSMLMQLIGRRAACPGCESERHSFWVFPILTCNKGDLIGKLRKSGFDATDAQSMRIVPPGNNKGQSLANLTSLYSKMVYLPFYPEIPIPRLRKMAEIVATG